MTHRQTTEEVIAGCEAAWAFFGGVFAVVVPDNMKAIVDRSDPLAPRFNRAFIEYAQARGFVVDPARVRTPTAKPRVERTVPFVRNSFFAGETFLDLGDAQRRAEEWCRVRAGMRIHGTIQCRPAELFALEEQPKLGPRARSRLCVVHENCDVHPVRDSELGEKARDVGFDGGLAHEQRCGNLGVGSAGPHGRRDLTLPVRERRQALGSEATAI